MITAFNVILLIVIVISFIGILGEKQDVDLRKRMSAVFVVAVLGFITSIILL